MIMGEISESLVRKLENAGLTEAERHVLAIAVGAIDGNAEVEGFVNKLGNFEIQDLMSRFKLAEPLALPVVINHEEQ
jgi:hypothetical protein